MRQSIPETPVKDMSVAELKAELSELLVYIGRAGARRMEISREIDERTRLAIAESRVDSMEPRLREALKEYLLG